ncbi:hypothetical protein CRE_22552 [Caenorhabditis remanei]|uniref:mitogen-activated protein kinase kinase n=1 Tax=Caenorhabditis remanei TaxID=31234 RepID=E3MU38_CAERE|nr:hypothetical protein CRE_22552 [Caenorhabditis remanei]
MIVEVVSSTFLYFQGSIHRDIKPGNLLCDDNGHIKIGDLGSCSRVEDIEIDEGKQSVAGTIAYQPPEAVSKTITETSVLKLDAWSLGISIVELATPKHPFSQTIITDQEDTLEFDIIFKNSPSLPTDQFNPNLCAFVSGCLKKIVEERMSLKDLCNLPYVKDFNGAIKMESREWFVDSFTKL